MTEKEKKILIKKIQKIIALVIVLGIVLFVLFQVLLPKEKFSSAAKELKKNIEQNPSDAMTQKRFVIGVIREQEQYDFDDRRKSKAIIEQAVQVGEDYLSTTDNNDFYIHLALARLHFQLAAIAQEEGEVSTSTMEIQSGLQIFNMLSKIDEDNLILRMNRATNLSNLPSIFGQIDNALKDFSFVAEKVLSSDFDVQQELKQVYYQGSLIVCLENGVKFANKNKKESTILVQALKEMKSLFDNSGIDKNDITVDMLYLE